MSTWSIPNAPMRRPLRSRSPTRQSLTYEPNPKHKPMPVSDRRGSICPSNANGPLLLSQSDLLGTKRYATDGESAYCAQQHAPGRWHGYPIPWDEVPPRLARSGWRPKKFSDESFANHKGDAKDDHPMGALRWNSSSSGYPWPTPDSWLRR